MYDVQATLTVNGVLLTIPADVKTPMGVQIIMHCPVTVAQCWPLLAFTQIANATSHVFSAGYM